MIKKLICFSLMSICLLSCFVFSVSAAQNIDDYIIVIEAQHNSGGTAYISPQYRRKYNDTSVYCENYSISGGSASCWVHRLSTSGNSDVPTPNTGNSSRVDRYYGGTLPYNGPPNRKLVPKGTYYYLPNYVNEDGYTHAALGYIMNKEVVKYKLGWSPDSI